MSINPAGSFNSYERDRAIQYVKENMRLKKGPALPEGYKPPDVALEPILPNSKYVYNTYVESSAKTKPNENNEKTLSELCLGFTQKLHDNFSSIIDTFCNIFDACDRDVAYCTELVKNNTNPENKDLFDELLRNANTRRTNIAEQAKEDLSINLTNTLYLSELTMRVNRTVARISGDFEEEERITKQY